MQMLYLIVGVISCGTFFHELNIGMMASIAGSVFFGTILYMFVDIYNKLNRKEAE